MSQFSLYPIFIASLLVGQYAKACRCEQQTLSDYFQSADSVIIASDAQVQSVNDQNQVLNFSLLTDAYKGIFEQGETLELLTGLSTASCAVHRCAPKSIFR